MRLVNTWRFDIWHGQALQPVSGCDLHESPGHGAGLQVNLFCDDLGQLPYKAIALNSCRQRPDIRPGARAGRLRDGCRMAKLPTLKELATLPCPPRNRPVPDRPASSAVRGHAVRSGPRTARGGPHAHVRQPSASGDADSSHGKAWETARHFAPHQSSSRLSASADNLVCSLRRAPFIALPSPRRIAFVP